MPEDTLLKVKESLANIEKTANEKLATLEGDLKATTEDKEAIKKTIGEIKEELKQVTDQLKQRNLLSLPGVNDGKNPYSVQMLIQALHRQVKGDPNPWRKSGVEKEALDNLMKQRATVQQTEDPEYGGYLVPDEVSNEIIDLAMAQMPIMGMGVTFFNGLHGDFSIPKTTQRPTWYAVGVGQKPTQSDAKLGKVWLRKKKGGAFTKITKDLVYQSRGVADAWLKARMSETAALGIHNWLLNGLGTDYEPLGIMNAASDGFTSTSQATNGTRFKFDKAATMIQNLEEANEINDAAKMNFLTRPIVKWGLKRQTVLQYSTQAAADGQPIYGMPFMDDATIDRVLGYPMRTTTHISKTLTKGTSSTCSAVILGDWSKFAIGMWNDTSIQVSGEAGDGSTGSALLDDEFYVVLFKSVDCNFLRQTAFTIVKDCETSAL